MDLVSSATARIALRPVSAQDAAAMQAYVTSMSPESRRLRFHANVNGCTDALLRLLTDVDPALGIGLVAVAQVDDGEVIVGEARYMLDGAGRAAEFAISVTDRWQGRGVADRLMKALIRAARAAGVSVLHGDVLDGNERMAAFMRRHGFAAVYDERAESHVLRWERELGAFATAATALGRVRSLLRRLGDTPADCLPDRGYELALE